MWSVEARSDAEDLVNVMARMREWLDARRIEPDIFRHNRRGAKRHNSPAVQGRKRGDRFRSRLLGPVNLIASTPSSVSLAG
jgi:hypothetical protein